MRTLLLALFACHGGKDDSGEPRSGTRLEWDDGLVVRYDGEERVRLPMDGLRVATTDEYEDLRSWDPAFQDPTAHWHTVTKGKAGPTETLLDVELTFDDGSSGTLTAGQLAEGRYALHLEADGQ